MVASAKKAAPRRKPPLLPADPVGARFCNFFNHPWKFIQAPVPAAGEKTQWVTQQRYPLMPRNLWEMYNNPDCLLGLRFGAETHYALIDIDIDSPYHPDNNLENFRSVLGAAEQIGLCRNMLVRSSESGGLHVYFFLPEPVPTFGLACALKFALLNEGLQLGGGQLEIFPNVKAYSKNKPTNYNAHRLPLQVGSYLLDSDCQPVTNNIALFLDWADQDATHQDMEELKEAIAAAVPRQKATSYNRRASNKAQEWKQHLESRIAQGWTGEGQTNDLLSDIVCYGIVWKGLSSPALINYVVETVSNSPGYREYCSHQHQIRQRVCEWVQTTENNQFYTPYCSIPQRLAAYSETYGEVAKEGAANNVVPFHNAINEERSAMAMERVKRALAHLEATNTLPLTATARALAIMQTTKALYGTTVSKTTLHKPNYLLLWHPKYCSKGCVLNATQKVSGESNESEKAEATPLASLIKAPEDSPAGASAKIPIPPPYMKVLGALSAPDAPEGHLGAEELEDLNLKQEVFVTTNVKQTTSSVIETDLTEQIEQLEIPTNSNPQGSEEVSETDENFNLEQKIFITRDATETNLTEQTEQLEIPTNSNPQITETNLTEQTGQLEIPTNSNPQGSEEVNETDENFNRLVVLRLELNTRALEETEQWVSQLSAVGRFLSAEKRIALETRIKMQLFWNSEEPILMEEADKWGEEAEQWPEVESNKKAPKEYSQTFDYLTDDEYYAQLLEQEPVLIPSLDIDTTPVPEPIPPSKIGDRALVLLCDHRKLGGVVGEVVSLDANQCRLQFPDGSYGDFAIEDVQLVPNDGDSTDAPLGKEGTDNNWV
jgi:hypothetical protein